MTPVFILLVATVAHTLFCVGSINYTITLQPVYSGSLQSPGYHVIGQLICMPSRLHAPYLHKASKHMASTTRSETRSITLEAAVYARKHAVLSTDQHGNSPAACTIEAKLQTLLPSFPQSAHTLLPGSSLREPTLCRISSPDGELISIMTSVYNPNLRSYVPTALLYMWKISLMGKSHFCSSTHAQIILLA